jgi:hypothetical protein
VSADRQRRPTLRVWLSCKNRATVKRRRCEPSGTPRVGRSRPLSARGPTYPQYPARTRTTPSRSTEARRLEKQRERARKRAHDQGEPESYHLTEADKLGLAKIGLYDVVDEVEPRRVGVGA